MESTAVGNSLPTDSCGNRRRADDTIPVRVESLSPERRAHPMAATAAAKPASKSEIVTRIAESTDLSRKQVKAVFDALSEQVRAAVGRRGPGVFTVPGLMKVT